MKRNLKNKPTPKSLEIAREDAIIERIARIIQLNYEDQENYPTLEVFCMATARHIYNKCIKGTVKLKITGKSICEGREGK